MIERFLKFIRDKENNDLSVEAIKENKEVLPEQEIAEIKENPEKKQNNSKNEILEIGTEKIEYHLPSFIVWAYSYASKIGSSGLRKKAKEMNDVSMSYIAPYVDIIVTEAKQVERYREIKEKGLINSLNNKIIKKYNEVIKKVGERILFNL